MLFARRVVVSLCHTHSSLVLPEMCVSCTEWQMGDQERTTEPKHVGPVGHGSPAAPRRLWVRSLVGTNFRLRVIKSPRLSHVQSTLEPGLTHKATGPRVRVGQGSGVFLACCEKVILPLKQCRGGGLTPRRSSFFTAKQNGSKRLGRGTSE